MQTHATPVSTSPPPLRSYQRRIVETIALHNTLVVLPTGAGKTAVAGAAIAARRGVALFLVPTRVLAGQQAAALATWTGLPVRHYIGSMAVPAPGSFRVLVATPAAFLAAQKAGDPTLRWGCFTSIVFDEVHHVVKNHPYRKVALALREKATSSDSSPRIIGLTASYTYEVTESGAKKSLQRLCDELMFTKLETATEEELETSGYHAKTAMAEFDAGGSGFASGSASGTGDNVIDDPTPLGVIPEAERQPHRALASFLERVESGMATPFALGMIRVVRAMEEDVSTRGSGSMPQYTSPVQDEIGSSGIKTWGAHAYKLRHRSERFEELAAWYEALRLLVASWEEDEDAAAAFLRMSNCDGWLEEWGADVHDLLYPFWAAVPKSFPRLERLKAALLEKHKTVASFRGIIFVQQRVTTHILQHVIRSDPELGSLFQPVLIYATSTPAAAGLSVSKRQTKERLAAFAAGTANLLITTVVAEEGLDVPAANCVIRYDAMLHAVSLVQGRGRARQANSSLVVLAERADRGAALLQGVAAAQMELVRAFQPAAAGGAAREAQEKGAAQRRDRDALAGLRARGLGEAAAAVQTFAAETKVDVEESWKRREDGSWVCGLSYGSGVRQGHGRGTSAGRKEAREIANRKLYQALAG